MPLSDRPGLPFFVLAIGLLLALPQPASGQNAPDYLDGRLKKVEEELKAGQRKASELDETANILKQEITEVREEKVRIAAAIRAQESLILQAETDLRALNASHETKIAEFRERRDQFSNVLIALQRLSRMPPEAVVAYPSTPSNLVRTAILLKSTVPRIEEKATRLREDLNDLEESRKLIEDRRKIVATAARALISRRQELDQIFEQKSLVRKQALAARQVEAARIDKLSREANDLRDLFDQLETERREIAAQEERIKQYQSSKEAARTMPRPLVPRGALASKAPFETQPISGARGLLTYPAIGPVTGRYGQRIRRGARRKGIDIETRAGAQVVAPYNGKIVFAGDFRGYGQLLIIEHGEGYHSLLAGMSRIDGNVGQWLLSGEPVGVMGSPGTENPTLYMELRKNGRSIDPNPWLASHKGKTNG